MIVSVQHVPLETLRRLAVQDPAQWADVYDDEMVRRHLHYRAWLAQTGRESESAGGAGDAAYDSALALHCYRHRT